ncbi:hypothetical protein COO60DRAFT_1502978 [Scenedesmus sp. NREL 46B-D3]|nr:hypothetical protein COO60DRAFT_1502978 [Scenedesmus sp. NREL 46B-D3]
MIHLGGAAAVAALTAQAIAAAAAAPAVQLLAGALSARGARGPVLSAAQEVLIDLAECNWPGAAVSELTVACCTPFTAALAETLVDTLCQT